MGKILIQKRLPAISELVNNELKLNKKCHILF